MNTVALDRMLASVGIDQKKRQVLIDGLKASSDEVADTRPRPSEVRAALDKSSILRQHSISVVRHLVDAGLVQPIDGFRQVAAAAEQKGQKAREVVTFADAVNAASSAGDDARLQALANVKAMANRIGFDWEISQPINRYALDSAFQKSGDLDSRWRCKTMLSKLGLLS
jgi:hypothetical protein